MRLPDRLQTRLLTLTNDLTQAAEETSRRARSWGEQVGSRVTRSSVFTQVFTRQEEWIRESLRERQHEEEWRADTGLTAHRVVQTSAPGDFTSSVMARIAAEHAPKNVAPFSLAGVVEVEPVRVVAGTLLISAMVALISSCVLAILAPTQALTLLSWVLSACMFVLLLLREILSLTADLFASSGALLLLGSLAALALLTLLRFGRGDEQIVREL